MKRKIGPAGVAIIVATAFIVALATPACASEPSCSLARAAGNWAFTDSGTVVGVGPRDAVGVFTLDAVGNLFNGVATSSLDGIVAQETFSGTYTVNPDCTGTITATIFASGTELFTVTLNIAFDQNMTQLRGIFTSAVEPNGTSLATVIALDARKQ